MLSNRSPWPPRTGWVKIFTPLDAELFTSKKALAMLADERNRHAFDQTSWLVSTDPALGPSSAAST